MSVSKWQAELARLDREREEILDQSTERRLEKNRLARQDAIAQLAEEQREENQRVNAVTLDPEHERLRQSNIDLMAQIRGLEERAMLGGGAFPEKYIRPDAVAFFSEQFQSARDRLSGVTKRIDQIRSQPHASAGGRLLNEQAEAEAIVAQWPKVEKLCRFGEQIFDLKETIRGNQSRMEELQAERREKALAAA